MVVPAFCHWTAPRSLSLGLHGGWWKPGICRRRAREYVVVRAYPECSEVQRARQLKHNPLRETSWRSKPARERDCRGTCQGISRGWVHENAELQVSAASMTREQRSLTGATRILTCPSLPKSVASHPRNETAENRRGARLPIGRPCRLLLPPPLNFRPALARTPATTRAHLLLRAPPNRISSPVDRDTCPASRQHLRRRAKASASLAGRGYRVPPPARRPGPITRGHVSQSIPQNRQEYPKDNQDPLVPPRVIRRKKHCTTGETTVKKPTPPSAHPSGPQAARKDRHQTTGTNPRRTWGQ